MVLPMKITVYTVPDCKFSQAEKAYLTSKNLQFEEKNLEANRDFLTEMLDKSNNFAGTPVTEIVKDDGTSVILKGYTQSELEAALNGTPLTGAQPEEKPKEEVAAQPMPEPMPAPVAPAPATAPMTPSTSMGQQEPMTQTAEASMVPPLPVSPLNEPMAPQTPMSQPGTIAGTPQNPVAPSVDSPFQMPTAPSAPTMTDMTQTASPAPQQAPQPFEMPQSTQSPAAPAPFEMPTAPAAPQPQTGGADPQLNSVLDNLQQKANS